MKYYKIEPTVDGSHGELSEFDPLSNKRRLLSFHLVLEDWFGEDIVTMTPGFAAMPDISIVQYKDVDVSAHWEPIPVFGDWESLGRFDARWKPLS